jgi:hypothetical protein
MEALMTQLRDALKFAMLPMFALPTHAEPMAEHQAFRVAVRSTPALASVASEINLIIWPRQSNSLSGATMTVTIDAQGTQTISNLDKQEMIDLGSYAVGVHSFALSAIAPFMIDQNGGSKAAGNGNGTCAGQFFVNPYQQYYFVMVSSPDGLTFQCQIR